MIKPMYLYDVFNDNSLSLIPNQPVSRPREVKSWRKGAIESCLYGYNEHEEVKSWRKGAIESCLYGYNEHEELVYLLAPSDQLDGSYL